MENYVYSVRRIYIGDSLIYLIVTINCYIFGHKLASITPRDGDWISSAYQHRLTWYDLFITSAGQFITGILLAIQEPFGDAVGGRPLCLAPKGEVISCENLFRSLALISLAPRSRHGDIPSALPALQKLQGLCIAFEVMHLPSIQACHRYHTLLDHTSPLKEGLYLLADPAPLYRQVVVDQSLTFTVWLVGSGSGPTSGTLQQETRGRWLPLSAPHRSGPSPGWPFLTGPGAQSRTPLLAGGTRRTQA